MSETVLTKEQGRRIAEIIGDSEGCGAIWNVLMGDLDNPYCDGFVISGHNKASVDFKEMKQRAYAIHNGPWLCASDIAALFDEAEKVAALQTENAQLRVRCKELREENENLIDKIVDTEH